eukprot:344073_1
MQPQKQLDGCTLILNYVKSSKTAVSIPEIKQILAQLGVQWTEGLELYSRGVLENMSMQYDQQQNEQQEEKDVILSKQMSVAEVKQEVDPVKPKQINSCTVCMIVSMVWFTVVVAIVCIPAAFVNIPSLCVNMVEIDLYVSVFALINVFILFVILLWQFSTSKNHPISRSTVQFGLMSSSLHIMTTITLCLIMIYTSYRILIVYNDDILPVTANDCRVNYHFSIALHVLINISFFMLNIMQYRKAFENSTKVTSDMFDEDIMDHTGNFFFHVCMIGCVGVFALIAPWANAVANNGNADALLIIIPILSNIAWVYFTWYTVPRLLVSHARGIRVSNNGGFNHKLYKALYAVNKYERLLYIAWITDFLSLSIWYLPWLVPISLTVKAWCIFLMYRQNQMIYRRWCGWCIRLDEEYINFNSLFISEQDSCSLLIPLISKREHSNTIDYDKLSINQCECDIDSCEAIHGIIKTLESYQSTLMQHSSIQISPIALYDGQQLLDKYIHIIEQHNNDNDLDAIFNLLIKGNDQHFNIQCDVDKCLFLTRHYRDRKNDFVNVDKNQERDDKTIFYTNLLDSIHCHLYHLYDTGFRINKHTLFEESDYKHMLTDETQTSFFDPVFSHLCDNINNAVLHLKSNGINSRTMNNKFNIHASTTADSTDTTRDKLFKLYRSLPLQQVQRAIFWFNKQEYDSEAIEYDVIGIEGKENSNIFCSLQNQSIYKSIKTYFHDRQLYASTCNIGYRFYYWKYYKTLCFDSDAEEWHWNKNDHSGYQPYALYVECKYESFKEEILNNTIHPLTLDEYNISFQKTAEYMKTEKVKQIAVKQLVTQDDPLIYNIKTGTLITLNHILSIIFYCDWSELCTEFSKTFRNATFDETISAIIQKHQEFAIWARYLRETIEYFGAKGFGDVVLRNSKMCIVNELIGPFYCGMSFEMVMPQFNIRLSSPTSTSLHIEVATRFAEEKGIVIQLNNDGTEISGDLRGFPCNWISNYSEEQEILFCGGEYRIRIESIITIISMQNFSEHLNALFYFDCMVNGSILGGHYLKTLVKTDYLILSSLIKHYLQNNGYINNYPAYINKTFEAYLNNKTEIVINIHEIHMNLSTISELILYPLCQTTPGVKNVNGKIMNLLKPVTFKLFKNVQHIIIYTKQIEFVEYKFDLLQFLYESIDLSQISNNTIISIKAIHPSWISSLCNCCCSITCLSFHSIELEFRSKGWIIEPTHNIDIESSDKIDCIKISRK